MTLISVARLFACAAFAGSLGMLNAVSANPVAKSDVLAKRGNFYRQEPICNNNSHCVYLENAVVVGKDVNTPCRCRNVDGYGNGADVCEFPTFSTVDVQCANGRSGSLTVRFGDRLSHYDTQGNIWAQWSSQKRGQSSPYGHYEDTNESGDDLYVSC